MGEGKGSGENVCVCVFVSVWFKTSIVQSIIFAVHDVNRRATPIKNQGVEANKVGDA